MPTYLSGQGPQRDVSKTVSSPRTRPLTRVIPCALTWAASAPRSAVENVGSPDPMRYRSPLQVAPARVPAPATVVANRKSGRRALSAPTVV